MRHHLRAELLPRAQGRGGLGVQDPARPGLHQEHPADLRDQVRREVPEPEEAEVREEAPLLRAALLRGRGHPVPQGARPGDQVRGCAPLRPGAQDPLPPRQEDGAGHGLREDPQAALHQGPQTGAL